MLSLVKRLGDFFIFSNLFISLCAFGLVMESRLLAGKSLLVDEFSLMVFCFTLCAYNAHRLLALHKLPEGYNHIALIGSVRTKPYLNLWLPVALWVA